MGRHIEFTGPEPYVILGALAAVWLLEHFGRRHFGPGLAARLGFPLPSTEKRVAANPETVPDNWFTNFAPLGNETWLIQDDANHWCFGVLRAERADGELLLTLQRRIPLAWVASIAAMFSLSGYVVEEDRESMIVSAVGYALIWSFQVLRSYLWLGSALREVVERVKGFVRLES